jgi:hypothetical protein
MERMLIITSKDNKLTLFYNPKKGGIFFTKSTFAHTAISSKNTFGESIFLQPIQYRQLLAFDKHEYQATHKSSQGQTKKFAAIIVDIDAQFGEVEKQCATDDS